MGLFTFLINLSLSYLTRPNPPKVTVADHDVSSLPKASADSKIPVVFGTKQISSPNVVWYGDLYSVDLRKKGGKK